MKKISFLLLMILVFVMVLTSCGEDTQEKERELFNTDLADYVKIGEYKGMEIDTASEEFTLLYNNTLVNDANKYSLFNNKTNGVVEKGDIVNIDYSGKMGSEEIGSEQGVELLVGSNNFFEDFENGLIGLAIGSTADINVTYPEDYENIEYAGVQAVFTVKVNSAKTLKPIEECFKVCGFETLEEYEEDVRSRTLEYFIYQKITEEAEILEYPKEDVDYILKKMKDTMSYELIDQYGINLSDYLETLGESEEQLDSALLSEQVYPLIQTRMPFYAIFDKENMTITDEEIDKAAEMYIKENGLTDATIKQVKDEAGFYVFECYTVCEKVNEFILKHAKIS